MDDLVTLKAASARTKLARPSREEAEAAVRTLIAWAGDDPDREGLANTPRRVAKAYEELFSGYRANAGETLSRVFHQVSGYEDLVLVRDISFVPTASIISRPSSARRTSRDSGACVTMLDLDHRTRTQPHEVFRRLL